MALKSYYQKITNALKLERCDKLYIHVCRNIDMNSFDFQSALSTIHKIEYSKNIQSFSNRRHSAKAYILDDILLIFKHIGVKM